jgi:6-phosphogluconolactonase
MAADRLMAAIAGAVARRGRADVATTGGSTCPEIYRALLEEHRRDRIPWDRLHLWFGDDRFVRRGDPESNLRPVDDVLLAGDAGIGLAPAPLPTANLHPVPVDAVLAAGGGPGDAAAAYERELRRAIAADAAGRPVFDAIMVGIGPDGHVLSIFPGSAAFDAPGWVVPIPAPSHVAPHVARVSLTPGALDATSTLLPVAFGPAKAGILAAVLAGPRDELHLPAQRARRAGATWILDAAAAADLVAAGSLPRP